VSVQGQQLSVALLSVGFIALGATQYLGSPWPGVVLSGLALLPWGLGAWLARETTSTTGAAVAMEQRLQVVGTMIDNAIVETHRAHSRLEEQGQQINSLRNAASLRGTLGG
jgi:hypothetical protein